MAQQILVPVLQRTLAEYLEVTDHTVDLRRGEIALAQVALRKQHVADGLEISGQVGRIFARWSWSGLLTRPIQIEVMDLSLRLSCVDGISDSKDAPAAAALDQPSNNFLERMKRKVMDQLQVTVSNVHLRVEGRTPVSRTSMTPGQLPVAGLVLQKFSIETEDSTLQQTVTFDHASLYLEHVTPTIAPSFQTPNDSAAWLTKEAVSPRCVARRRAGRRFVDWKGLDLQFELNDMKLQWTRRQLLMLMSLLGDFCGSSQEVVEREGPAASAGEDFFECEEEPAPAVEKPSRPSWSNWFRSWLHEGAEVGEELPSSLEESEVKMLMEETTLKDADELTMSILMTGLEMHAIESCLKCWLGGRMNLKVQELDSWDLNLDVTECALLETGAAVPGAEQVHVGHAIAGPQSSEPIVIKAQRGAENLLNLSSPTMDLHLTPKLCRSLVWLSTAMTNALPESECGGSTDWQVTWKLPLALHVGQPWQLRSLVSNCCMSGSYQKDFCSGEVLMTINLDGREILEPFHLEFQRSMASTSSPWRVAAQQLTGTCEVSELVSVVRMVKSIMNEVCHTSTSIPTENLPNPPELAEVAEVQVALPHNSSPDLLIFSLGEVAWRLNDPLLKASFVLKADALGLQLGTKMTQASLEMAAIQMHLAEVNCGCVELAKPWLQCELEGARSSLHVQGQLRVEDPSAEDAAISCQPFRCDISKYADVSPTRIEVSVRCAGVRVNSTESYLLRCKLAVDFWVDLTSALFIDPFLLEERPFGFRIQDGCIAEESSYRDGLLDGCLVVGLEPPAEDLPRDLLERSTPVVLLVERTPEKYDFKVTVSALELHATQISLEQTTKVPVVLANSKLQFQESCVHSPHTSWGDLGEKVSRHYVEQAIEALPKLFCNLSVCGRNLFGAAASSAGCSLAMLRFGGMATGAAAGTLAEGLVMTTRAAVAKGKEIRDGKDGYQFGDFTKGLLRLSHERGRHILGTYDDTGGAAKAAAVGSVSGVCSYAYQTSAVSSTLGAALGGTVGAPLGMVGVSAGMAAGSTAARRVSQGVSQCGTKVQKMVSSAVAEGKTARGDAEGQYRLGDFTSGVLAAGREARGANEGSRGYKPGDFTRGLFSKLRK
ncbi:unnamed protein product [Durusdinium trenchii]|uniref:Autophagy-related protein 2 n=1 Tax=Durusdinium trenchii TaxID=1381693 RepID=A0ABP0I7F4_9DINO